MYRLFTVCRRGNSEYDAGEREATFSQSWGRKEAGRDIFMGMIIFSVTSEASTGPRSNEMLGMLKTRVYSRLPWGASDRECVPDSQHSFTWCSECDLTWEHVTQLVKDLEMQSPWFLSRPKHNDS